MVRVAGTMPGIGRRVLWQYVLQAVGHSFTVLSCRSAPATRRLAFPAHEALSDHVAGRPFPLRRRRWRVMDFVILRDPGVWHVGSWTRCGSLRFDTTARCTRPRAKLKDARSSSLPRGARSDSSHRRDNA
jgi:hypothetical protein